MKNLPTSWKIRNFFKNLLKLTRFPNLLIIGFTQYFAAIFLIGHPDNYMHLLTSFNMLVLSSSTVIIAAAGYIINDYYDVKIDYVNKPDKVIVGRHIKRRVVIFSHTALNVAGITLGLWLSWKIAVINFIAAFLLWLYSNQLKRLPFVGNFIISILTGLSIIIVAVYFQRNFYLVLNYSVFAFSITIIREIIKDMEDITGDERYGSRTLPIIWGIRKTKRFLYFLIAIFVVVLFYLASLLGNQILNNFFLILLIPIAYFVYLLYRADTRNRYNQLSNYCKLFMLAGILSMTFF